MDTEGTPTSPTSAGADGGDNGPVVLILTQQQTAALTTLIASSGGHDPGLEAVRTHLHPSTSQTRSAPSSAADAVFAAAQAVVAGTQTDMAAEREARDVAEAVASTEELVLQAALMTAKAASHERERKAHAADTAAQNMADTAAQTAAGIQIRADAQAVRVATAAATAAETVSASIASGGDAEALLTALRLAATVDAAAIATAEETALAAAAVATAVAAAAAQAALTAAIAAAAFEQEVSTVAAAVRLDRHKYCSRPRCRNRCQSRRSSTRRTQGPASTDQNRCPPQPWHHDGHDEHATSADPPVAALRTWTARPSTTCLSVTLIPLRDASPRHPAPSRVPPPWTYPLLDRLLIPGGLADLHRHRVASSRMAEWAGVGVCPNIGPGSARPSPSSASSTTWV